MNVKDKKTFSIPEVAKALGICKTHAYKLAHEGRFPVLKLGRRLVIPKNWLEEFLDQEFENYKTKKV